MASEDRRTLEYESPRPAPDPDPATRWAAGCFGLLALMFGLPFFVVGLRALAGIVQPNKFLRSDEFYHVVVGLPLGVVCLTASVRWFRRWLRGAGR